MRASKASEQTGGIILSRVNACAPPLFCILRRAWENRRVRRACRPSGAISSERSKAKEQSNVFSPTETPLKEHQPNKLQKPESSKPPPLIARRNRAARLAAAPAGKTGSGKKHHLGITTGKSLWKITSTSIPYTSEISSGVTPHLSQAA